MTISSIFRKKKLSGKFEIVRRGVEAVLVASVWLCLWWGLSLLADKKNIGLLLPAPISVWNAFLTLIKSKNFYISCLNSLKRVMAAWGLGLSSGIVLSILTYKIPPLHRFFSPAVHVVKATPVASFIILALVLMKSGTVPVFTGALMSLPIVWANISEGLNASDPKLIQMADAFEMSRKNRLRYLRLPALKPYFTAAATTSMGLTWKASIAAEVICVPKNAIGTNLYDAKVYLEIPSLFAWTLSVILMSVLLEKLLVLILNGGKKHD